MEEIKEGYKKTKVGIVPGEWEVVKLGNIAYIDKNNLTNKVDSNFEFEYISLSDVNNGVISNNLKKYIFSEAPSRARRIVKQNDILFSTVRPNLKGFGQYKDNKKNIICSTGFAVITAKSIASQDYLYHNIFSLNIEKQLFALLVGSNYPAINSSDVKKLKIPLPPIEEQTKIAKVLSLWDEMIEKQTNLLKQKKLYKKGLMQRLLRGEMRFKEFNENWKNVKLFEIAKIVMGQSPSSKFYNENRNGLPLIQGNADCKNRKTSPRIYTTEKTKECKVGDIIMTVRAPVGAISKSYHNACIGRGVCSISTKQNNNFLYQYLINYEQHWKKLSQGSTFESINSIDIKTIKISLPTFQEQTKIANILNLVDREIELLEKELHNFKLQKKGLMQKLLSGEVRVLL